MAWIFSIKHSEMFYREFIRERGEEVFTAILKKNQRSINAFDHQERNQICDQLKNYIFSLAHIFNINRAEEENCEVMPAMQPNNIGDIYDEMLELDVNAFLNEESHYNIKKKSGNIYTTE